MSAPIVPFNGKDADRLAKLSVAYNALLESGSFLENWPSTVATAQLFKERIEDYRAAYEEAIHRDRRAIAQRNSAGEIAGTTWQKIVNYACSTEQDNAILLERMGVTYKTRRAGSATAPDLYPPNLTMVNLDQKGGVRGSCPRERRRYTHEIEVTEGDPRVEEGWYHKASFGDCTQMDMNGFQSGQQYSFRCRIIGRNNEAGPWSHTITLMVT